jgi:predicted amidohydrolase YtcJ
LIESHEHFMGLGSSKLTLDLMDVKDWDEIVSMVAAAAKQAKPGRLDSRPRLAPGKVEQRAEAERRRLSVSRCAQQGLAR